MSRMLDALKQIESRLPQRAASRGGHAAPAGAPNRRARPKTPRPDEPGAEAGNAFSVDRPAEPIEQPGLVQPPAELFSQMITPQPASRSDQPMESDFDIGRVLGPLAKQQEQSYRQLAENILAQLRPDDPAAVMFTSPGLRWGACADAIPHHRGEGKTRMLVPLAVVLAEQVAGGVVVVDANFRHPELASHFGIRAERGLVDLLAGAASWQEVVCQTGVERLSVLPGGRFPGRGGHGPRRSDLAAVLDELRGHYRLVLLDTASLAHPEVAPMAGLCEGTYLVIQLGRTPRRAARRAIRLIQRCGGWVLGCVLTGLPAHQTQAARPD